MLNAIRSPALGAAGLILGEIAGNKLAPSLPQPTSKLTALVLPAIMIIGGQMIARKANRSVGRGIQIGAMVHAIRTFTNFDSNLETW